MKPEPAAQLAFSPIFGHTRPSVRQDEIAKALGIGKSQVHSLLDADEFRGIPINDAPDAQRCHLRVLRTTVEAWWLENYFLTHREEYPFPNSPEHTWWRQELRKKRAALPGIRIPSL